jgi:regulator of protease activity HflC (stomatin/prohibitin superfamily)
LRIITPSTIYSATQAAVRTAVAGVTMDALLNQRVEIAGQLRELITPHAEALGVLLHAVEVRDVMLPGDLRKAFSGRAEGEAGRPGGARACTR